MRKEWSEKMIIEGILESVKIFGRFPRNHDLRNTGRSDLANKISRTGGFEFWSKKLNLTQTETNYEVGLRGENEVLSLLIDNGFDAKLKSGNSCHYDILVNGILRIDVKNTRFTSYRGVSGWFYNLNKYYSSDMYALYQEDTNDTYFIPWNKLPENNITITEFGKYSYFKNNLDLVRDILDLRTQENDLVPV